MTSSPEIASNELRLLLTEFVSEGDISETKNLSI